MRFKKQIIIICLLTFLMVPFNRSSNARASTFVLDPLTISVLYALGEIACVVGAVALTGPMLADMGQRVVNELDDVGRFIVGGAINVTTEVIEAAKKAISKFPTSSVVETFTPTDFSSFSLSGSFPLQIDMYDITQVQKLYSFKCLSNVNIGVLNGAFTTFTKGNVVNVYSFSQQFSDGLRYRYSVGIDGQWVNQTLSTSTSPFTVDFSISGDISDFVGYKEIPYSDTTTKDYEEKNWGITFPGTVAGTHTGLWDIPKTDEEGSYVGGFPVTGDILKDKVHEKPIEDSSLGDNSISKPDTGDSIFDKFGSWLGSLLGSLFKPLVDLLKGILDFLKNLFIPSELIDLDFTPLYFDLTKKFPFCLPFDFARFFTDFNNLKERPILHIQMPEKYFNSYTLDIDLAFYDDYFPFSSILRYFLLISFIYYLIKHSRNIIGG